jgi:hypothetical protein
VLFNVCDSYIRRNEGQERVIGTLLGRHAAGGGGCAARRRHGRHEGLTPCFLFAHSPRLCSVVDGGVEIRNSYAVPHSESGGQARAPRAAIRAARGGSTLPCHAAPLPPRAQP